MLEIIFLLLLIASGQGVFLSLFIIFYKRKIRWVNILLGFLFLAFSLQLFDFVLLYSQKALEYPHLVFWSMPFNFTFGPLLYLYIKSFKIKSTKVTVQQLLHFIPFLLHFSYIFIIYHLKTTAYKIDFVRQSLVLAASNEISPGFQVVFSIIVYTHFGIYMWLAYKQIKKSDMLEVMTRIWLRKLWIGIMVIGVFGFIQFLLLIMAVNQKPFTGYLAAILALIYIYYGAIIVMKKPEIIFNPPKQNKYQYSNLTKAEGENLVKKLRAYMKEHTPYKNPDLNIKGLASMLKHSDRHISQVINEQLQQNFHDFLNEYRVNEFKTQLNNPANSHLSILGIAMECGFNSKSTFNTVFRKHTGMTPTAFKKKL